MLLYSVFPALSIMPLFGRQCRTVWWAILDFKNFNKNNYNFCYKFGHREGSSGSCRHY